MTVPLLGRWEVVKAESEPATGGAGGGLRRTIWWLRRTCGPNPDEDALLSTVGSPTFDLGACVLALAVAALAVVGSLTFDDGDDRYNIGLVVATVVPWVLFLLGIQLPRAVFAAWVLLPTFVLSAISLANDLVHWDAHWEGPNPAFSFGAQFSLFLVLLMLAHFIAAPRRQTIVVTAAALAVITVRFVEDGDGFNLIIWSAGLGFVTVAGVGIRISSMALIRARDALAAERASAQRRQIARDVHDVVAHTLAVTMLHMTAARMAVQRASPGDAIEALEEAEKHGRTSLSDIRRIIRVLRSDDESAVDAAQPDLADIATLVERYRSAGLPVELNAHGSTETVSASTGLAAFRVTQEALANAARHGDGGATVDLRVEDGEIRLRVWNPAAAPARRPADGHGTGLIGMRERVHAAGGTLETGAADGRWLVHATLPVTAADGGGPGP